MKISFILFSIGIALIIISLFLVTKPLDSKTNTPYQGPVPQGYDEQHFRETGETIPSTAPVGQINPVVQKIMGKDR